MFKFKPSLVLDYIGIDICSSYEEFLVVSGEGINLYYFHIDTKSILLPNW